MKTYLKTTLIVLTALVFNSCLSSVSTQAVKKEGTNNSDKGKALLDESWLAQGMDNLKSHTVYQVEGIDKWKGVFGHMGKVWPDAEASVRLKYRVGSFDGQVEILEGKKKGFKAGLQSWNYYEKELNQPIEFKSKENDRLIFGISAYQYFFELIDRLKDAPIITYAGQDEINGKKYDLIFVTWEKIKTHKQHDQYLAWINQETKLMDFCEFTIHDSFLPGGSLIPGSIEFADFRNVDGVEIPYIHYIYAGSPKEKKNKFLHRLTVDSFMFDSFDETELSPNKEIKIIGNSKEI